IPGQSRNELADRILGLGGTLAPIPGQVAELESAIARTDKQRFSIEAEGANPDGSGDNTAAVQAAIDKATAAGGGTVWLDSPVDYICDTATSAAGLTWILGIAGDNITIDGVPGSGLRTTTGSTLLHITGAGKP